MILSKIKDFVSFDDNYAHSMYSLGSIIIMAILAYNMFFVYGFTNPDGINEGFYYYSAANWASQGCGRWLIRYFNAVQGNIVIPVVTFFEYCIFTWLTVVAVCNLLDLKNILSICVVSILFIVLPGVITQMTYIFTAHAYAFAGLLSSLFVCFNYCKNKWFSLIASFCLAGSMGLYQSYLGISVCLALMSITIKFIRNEDYKALIDRILRFLLSALLAALLYYLLYKIDLHLFGLETVERVNQFDLTEIIRLFVPKFLEMYKVFFCNFSDAIFKRNYLYCLLLVAFVFIVAGTLLRLIKRKKYSSTLVLVMCIALIPPASSIIGILIPFNNVNLMMSNQNFLIVPFGLALLEMNSGIDGKIMHAVSVCLLLIMSWTYVLSANATYRSYKMSYVHINSEMTMTLYDVYHLDGYEKDVTPIMLAGFPDDHVLREKMPIYRYTIELYPNVVFWQDMSGVINNRYNYLLNCFGIDAGFFDEQQYYDVMTSAEFEEMPIWPKEGSVRMIDGFAVVKYRDDPLLPSWD